MCRLNNLIDEGKFYEEVRRIRWPNGGWGPGCTSDKIGCNAELSAAIIDSQTVKGTSESVVESGFDGNKKIKGRKRYVAVDIIGCVI